MSSRTELRAWRAELDERNVDNISRTASYLELYAWTREHDTEMPWLLMAHLVSRNAGYLMTDLARQLAGPMGQDAALADAMRSLFVLLERGNFLIFWDAWHHVLTYLAGELDALAPPRTPAFMCDAWRRYDRERAQPSAELERRLVLDLVHNEQNLIERRAVHHPDLAPGLRLLSMIEATGRERPMVFPRVDGAPDPEIRVGGFADLDKRIATGRRIFDEVLADRTRRDAMFAWAMAHPHTGSREVYGGKPGPGVRQVWPVAMVRELWAHVHAVPEPDPLYP